MQGVTELLLMKVKLKCYELSQQMLFVLTITQLLDIKLKRQKDLMRNEASRDERERETILTGRPVIC